MLAATLVAIVLCILFFLPGISESSGRGPTPDEPFFETPPDTGKQNPIYPSQQSGGQSRLGGRTSSGIGGSTSRRDTSRTISEDSTWVVYLDSTARLSQWKYKRHDKPYVQYFPDRVYPLYAQPTQTRLRYEVLPDSNLSMFRFRQTIEGEDVKIPRQLSLKEYVARRQKFELHKIFADEARRPKALGGKKDIGDLFSSFTKISIPIPANPVLSIFGKPEINLQISGAVDIRAGFRNSKSDQTTANRLDQTRNEPDFNQEVQVNVNGTIGDKLNILADWNTQRTFEYENQLKIKYTGYDDEIVQSIEAGNVSLQTPSSFIGSSAALFGIKAKFQAGPLSLTTIVSQKKGQIKQVEAKGGAQEIPFEIQPWNYATNNFFVDLSYRSTYESWYQSDIPTGDPNKKILEEEVWVSFYGNDQTQTVKSRQGVAYISLPERPPGQTNYSDSMRTVSEVPGNVESARFVRLDPSQYELVGDGYIGVIALNQNVGDNQIVAIAYRTQNNQFGELTANNPATSDTSKPIILKMVKPKNLLSVGSTYATAWKMLLKNIYSLGGRNVKELGFSLDIYRRVSGVEDQNAVNGEPLLRVLGVDQYNTSGTRGSDNIFDFRPGRTINLSRAEIIFPSLRPFDSAFAKYFVDKSSPPPDSSYLFPEIYDTTKTAAQQSIHNKYVIKGKATGEVSSKYSLGFNVVEGSVRVYENGVQLTANIDYTVDYIVGEVLIRKPSALVPGANLQIKYEQNDLFQLASKTLLGARADLFVSQNTSLGFTIMNLNQQSLSDKVRLGEEPNTNTIYGVDGQTSFKLPFLTSAINALPVIATRENSELKLSGEAAYIKPDPNTRKSPIPSDGGASIAYIDDFEGARRTIPLGTNYTNWTQASAPVDTSLFAPTIPDSTKMNHKAKSIWFNIFNSIKLTDVYPDKLVGNAANNLITVMDLWYFPQQRGMYNYNRGNVSDSLRAKNWGGIMKPISVSGTNLVNENISFIEVWMQVGRNGSSNRNTPGKMYIDLGSISEDVIPNRSLNTEDLVPPSTTINNSLQPWEDVGLDMITDDQERALYPTLGGDPSGDDYAYDNNNTAIPAGYQGINGTENNRNSVNGLYPDTEDLNANGIVDLGNSYFRYEVSLDTVRSRNPQIVGGGIRNSPYYQFRIPIRNFVRKIGTPSFENVEFIRVSFQNAEDTVALRIADFSLVGNQWQELKKEDTTFAVSVVGIEENSNTYSPPVGVVRERDKTQPDQQVYANEQSLALILKGIPDGESKQAIKHYDYRPLDLFSYKTMKLFVHGDDSTMNYVDVNNYSGEFFFRFGADSLNFYEYREPIHKGWDPLNDVVIRFADLTAIKQGRDSSTQFVRIPVPGGPPGSFYSVLGNPSLTQIRYMSVGVENPAGKGTTSPLYGQVWVDELRVIEVDDSPGWAYRFDANLKIADLGAVSFNYSKIDPNFHSIDQRLGSRQTGVNWGINANMELGKFFPAEWTGTTLAISYAHSENLVRPKYLPNSDVLVGEAANRERDRLLNKGISPTIANASADDLVLSTETYRVTDTWAAPNFRIGLPSDAWWIRDTWNKLSLGFNYTRSTERNPSTIRRLSWQWNAKIQYQITFDPEYYFQPFSHVFDGIWLLDEYKDLKIWFAPQNLSWSLTTNRSRDVSQQRTLGAQELVSRNFNASRSFGFGWKLTENGLLNPSGDYSLSVESSLLDLETDPITKQQRSFSRIVDDIFFNNSFINFGQDTRYSQRNSVNTKPNIPNILNIKKYLDLSAGYSVDYNWQNALTRGDLGKSAGWSNNINLSMNFKLKSLFDPLFEDTPAIPSENLSPKFGRRGPDQGNHATENDSLNVASVPDSTKGGAHGFSKTLDQMKQLAKIFIKIPFLDYESINVTFTQNNQSGNSGVVGRPGFVNFWGRLPFLQDADPRYGPSRLYQLGLISDPNGKLTNFGPRSKFPFFGWDVEPGIRAGNGVLQNSFRQTNRLSFKTTRSLWEGARLDLNWNVGWSFSSSENVTTDSLGQVIRVGPNAPQLSTSGSVDRSFITFPNVLFLGVFKSDLKEVSKRYAALKANKADSATFSDEEKIAKAFEEGFEALPFFRKIFGQFAPRVNWSLRWDGLEKIPMFSGFVSRLSLDHSYTSNYTRSFENRQGSQGEKTTGQRISYGFAPLVGMNFTFKDLLKGSMGANVRYNTNTTYDLATSSRNLVETLAQEISLTASYSRRGFEIPFFGLSLNNDIEINASYSLTKNSRKQYEISKLDVNTEGTPLEGSTRTVFEPRIKYVLSQRVNAAIYYRLTKITPDAQGSAIPGSTTNEAGLDIHIAIQ